MRKILNTLLAAALVAPMLAPAAAMADPYDHGGPGWHGDRDHGPGPGGPGWHGDRGPGWHGDRGWHDGRPGDWRQFRRGERFDRDRAWRYGELDYRAYHGLRRPPRGYHWVRNGDDALLIGITSGIVASVIVGAIR
ncbi:MAG TPA: RcnB family protein [Novosphingobium sp.]|nr:RcnB family protein [Novosphingobium sp.]